MTKEEFLELPIELRATVYKLNTKQINKLFFTGQRGDGLRLPVGGVRTPRQRLYVQRKEQKNV